MKKVLYSIVAVVALGAFADAGGKLVEPPTVPPISIDDWSGPYIGLQAGYIKGDGDTTINSPAYGLTSLMLPDPETYKATNKPDGFIGGLYVGYNKLLQNNWLIGVELAGNYVKIDKTSTLYNSAGSATSVKFNLKQKNEGALYLKFGKVINNQYMPYILGGVTGTKLEGTVIDGANSYKDSDTVTGFTVGAGLEFKINRNWHARVQYRYSKYDDAKFSYNVSGVTLKGTTDYKTHTVQAGISYHF
jgi:outer membrane immunogenic protein